MESVKLFQVKDRASLQTTLEQLCQVLAEWGVAQERIFDCKLIACELVGNVLKYATGEAGMRVSISKDGVEIKALSETFFELPENIVCSGLYAESGRGLFLVKSLCDGKVFSEEDGIVAIVKL